MIGLCSPHGCQGVWDNYQCKHYETTLGVPAACEDAGKIIFHAFRGEFTPPRMCSFVAPHGPSTALREDAAQPGQFRDEVIKTWNSRVAPKVVENEKHTLTGDLAAYVAAYDFTSFTMRRWRKCSTITATRPTGRPGSAASCRRQTRADAGRNAPEETVYVAKLLDVYAEETGVPISCADDLAAHAEWQDDLQKQRVRFYDAEAFMATYRDQTEPGTIESFADQILDAIDPAIAMAASAHGRLTTALSRREHEPASVLSAQAKIRVKQGVCHQLANADRVTWKV